MNWWNLLIHPALFFARMQNDPPLGCTLGLLIALSTLWALAFDYDAQIQGRRPGKRTREGRYPFLQMLGMTLVISSVWVLFTFLALCLMRLFHNTSSFERLFCVLAWSGVPSYLARIICPLRDISRVTHYLRKGFILLMLIWTTALLLPALQDTCHLSWWQTALTALPVIAALGAVDTAEMSEPPETFQASNGWRRARGERVVVFYPPGKSGAEVDEIVQGCDKTLQQVTALLDVEPLKFKVFVFLLPDKTLHQKLMNNASVEKTAAGYAHDDSISLVYDKWEEIIGIVAHEFCHVLRQQRIAPNLYGLLDEGLACYTKMCLAPNAYRPTITLPVSLRILAHYQIFYEWLYADQPEYPSDSKYAHAHAFVTFLIERYGMEAFKQLCKEASASPNKEAGEQLANAIQSVYGVSLKDLEAAWRRDWNPNQLDFRFASHKN